ncbi:glyoxylase-like metal-dependent hydrolase (beta-lactamase superfamily II) [Scopulibacillus darangshiensis]|uniref:Glyoxylase-like metal-dependent hydrolase (Beta-lactamase superfamily II) n=1 Tax=Scopulibacillus darangshiensis TaxID=442528 RepID=A0A4R2NQX4_9BACL|nr:MBL fold metallo-hydrolase [Scopulibacillus darangshiensis]TCP23804.1 glyoxylase-like metal-dependent hydrolase (beta-lactamase superfamily II) [Scopulibacillus darangshiensis]
MELRRITDDCWYFHSPVNVGYIKNEDTGVLIDAGLDASAIKKVLRQLDEKDWPLTHLLITHAHADHFGGAHTVQKKRDIRTIAPSIEADILAYPKWEPLYLYQGNEPPAAMRTKFLEGKAARVDELCDEGMLQLGDVTVECIKLDGHSENQMGIIYKDILYAADSYMSLDYLEKHGIPFLIDLDRTLASLKRLLDLPVSGAVPGHGVYEENFKETVQNNIDFHQRNAEQLYGLFEKHPEGLSQEGCIQLALSEWRIELKNIGSWALYRTAITGYLHYLCREGRLAVGISQNVLWFKRGHQ